MLSWHLAVMGSLERLEGNLDASRARGEEALELARRLGSGWMQAGAERLLGRLALAAGEASEAERYIHAALGRVVAKGFALDIPECLDVLAAVAAAQESFEEAARLLGAAAAGRARLGIVRFPLEPEFWSTLKAPRRRRSDPTATTPRSPPALHWESTRQSATSAGPGVSESAHRVAGTA